MRILVPQQIDLISSNLPVSTLPEWASGTAYSTGTEVKVSFEANGTTPRWPVIVYRAMGSTTGDYPPTAATTKWRKVSAQNRDRMFDGFNNSRSLAEEGEDIAVSIETDGRTRYLYLTGMRDTTTVRIQEEIDGAVEIDNTYSLETTLAPVGMHSYLFAERSYKRSLSYPVQRLLANQQFHITLAGVRPQCAQILASYGFDIGPTEWELDPGLKDYSTFEANEFGSIEFIPRENTRTISGTVWIDSPEYDRVYSILEDNNGSLILFDFNNEDSGDYSLDAGRIYGKLDDFSGGIRYNKTPINFKVLGYN